VADHHSTTHPSPESNLNPKDIASETLAVAAECVRYLAVIQRPCRTWEKPLEASTRHRALR